jgi:CRISPR system Cascade subunit CasC
MSITMKLIEVHILQSFPVSCLNRDDVGAPKSAIFGGVNRARISSQCLKRAIREHAQDLCPELFQGHRSRLIITPLRDALAKAGVGEPLATDTAKLVGEHLATLDKEAEKKGELKVKTLMFLSPAEVKKMATTLADILKANPKAKDMDKAAAKAAKAAALKDAADIAIFGRMVASDHSLTVEGAGLFSHALSTHRADNEIDFFSAVDDLQKAEESGAGMTGTLEFTSACYYRYAAVNVDLLRTHLAVLTPLELNQVVDAFLRATLLAVPSARKNSMNAHTVPAFVLGTFRETGQPIQLVNAFESPVRPRGDGLIKDSIAALEAEFARLKETWGVVVNRECRIPSVRLEEFCAELLAGI